MISVPRCAGKTVKQPDDLGIKICKESSECGVYEFCDIQSNENNPVSAFSNLGVCCHCKFSSFTFFTKNQHLKSNNFPLLYAYMH